MEEKELELYRFIKIALESGATIKMTEKEKGGLFVRGRKLTDTDLLECITDPKPMTNADCLRVMTDEELATWLNDHNAYKIGCYSGKCSDKDCVKCWLDWLKQYGGGTE